MSRPVLLVPTTPADIAPRLVATAAELARSLGAELELLTVGPPLDVVDPHTSLPPTEAQRDVESNKLREATREALAEPLDVLRGAAAEVRVVIAHGSAVEAILNRAEVLRPDFIVMGTSARAGLRRALLGSVAEGVLRKAPCPVVVVPPRAEG